MDETTRWARIEAIFAQALRAQREERTNIVESATDDSEIRREVLSLLASHDDRGPLDELGQALEGEVEIPPEAPDYGVGEVLTQPEQIGPYRVLRVIGEGGMGVVFEAEQREPVHRRVAVKMMKVGMDTREVVGRFEAERQALAMMDHPGIAKVLDAGVTHDGRPYFVMDLVAGVRIDEFCDLRRLTTDQRVQLFIDVCAAVQHAHQKGIIHRDLKPSNVMVTEDVSTPLPRVIDFGIAKATGQRLTDKTVVTTLGQALGTLTYMSPEQADTRGLDVDTRTDIFALGVILYELLLGVVPVDPKDIGAPAFLARLIQPDSTAPPLSRRLTGLGAKRQKSLAAARRTDARTLRRVLSTDLQWIVLKALEKDRERRYETASALADDLRRYLRDEPVLAHPPATRYRLGKFVRRNRVSVSAAAAVAMILVASTILIAQSRSRALASERDALAQAARAEAVNGFLVELLGSADPSEDGREVRVVDVLDRASDGARARFEQSPVSEGSIRFALGTTYNGLGLYEESERELREAASLYRELDDPELAPVLVQLSEVLMGVGELDQAQDVLQEALTAARRRIGERAITVGAALSALGATYYFQGDFVGAANTTREALALYADSLTDEDELVIYARSNLAAFLEEAGEFEAALELKLQALEGVRALQGPDHVDVATISGNLAITLQRLDRNDEAEPYLLDALRISRIAYGTDSDRTARALNNLGAYYRVTGRPDQAVAVLEEALAINRAVLGEGHREVSSNLLNLGNARLDLGEYEEALVLFRSALAIIEVDRPDHSVRAQVTGSIGWALRHLDRLEEAESALREGLVRSKVSPGPEHFRTALVELRLGEVLRARGRLEEAESHLLGGRGRLVAALDPEHRMVLEANEILAGYYEQVGQVDVARRYRNR